jgi:hypothetical protein
VSHSMHRMNFASSRTELFCFQNVFQRTLPEEYAQFANAIRHLNHCDRRQFVTANLTATGDGLIATVRTRADEQPYDL